MSVTNYLFYDFTHYYFFRVWWYKGLTDAGIPTKVPDPSENNHIVAAIQKAMPVLPQSAASLLDETITYIRNYSPDNDSIRTIELLRQSIIISKFDPFTLPFQEFIWWCNQLHKTALDCLASYEPQRLLNYLIENQEQLLKIIHEREITDTPLFVIKKVLEISQPSLEFTCFFKQLFTHFEWLSKPSSELIKHKTLLDHLHRHRIIDFDVNNLLAIFQPQAFFSDSQKCDQELSRRIFLAHVWEIDGKTSLNMVTKPLHQGFKTEISAFMWSFLAKDFLQKDNLSLSQDVLEELSIAINNAYLNYYWDHRQEICKKYGNKYCTIVPFDQSEHCIWFVFRKNHFLVCNRGRPVTVHDGKNHEWTLLRGLNYFSMGDQKYSLPEIDYCGSCNIGPLNIDGMNIYSHSHLTLDKTIKLPPQGLDLSTRTPMSEDFSYSRDGGIGNCTWASASTAFLGLLTLFIEDENEAFLLYKKFLLFAREKTKEMYLNFPFDEKDQTLIRAVNEKKISLEDFAQPETQIY